VETGLYGKLPTHGDFLQRRVPEGMVQVWDRWLQESMAASREVLGADWLETYLTSPVWRFVLGAGACGSQPIGGILVPSVDRVGRYFPLTLMWSAPPGYTALELAERFQRWFDIAEKLVVDTLIMESIDFAAFDRAVAELDVHLDAAHGPAASQVDGVAALLNGQNQYWRLPLPTTHALGNAVTQLLGAHLDNVFQPVALWWSQGSTSIDPGAMISKGLPAPQCFAAMLDGSWAASGWSELNLLFDAERDAGKRSGVVDTPSAQSEKDAHPYCRSAGQTDVGAVRSTNQDAYLERPEVGLWVVADGIGGLSHGEVASRMVCDALADVAPSVSLDDLIEAVRRRLEEVNAYLRRGALRPVNAVQSGSTVVALLIIGRECAVLWAGDSRAYRLRDGLLSQLTADHSWGVVGLESSPGASIGSVDKHAVTRAVGGEDHLDLEVWRTDVRLGDRFLLCSDGLYGVLSGADISRILEQKDVAACCSAMIASALERRASDNVTAVVVDCSDAGTLASSYGQP
jgi:type VI secretion system protein ImpM